MSINQEGDAPHKFSFLLQHLLLPEKQRYIKYPCGIFNVYVLTNTAKYVGGSKVVASIAAYSNRSACIHSKSINPISFSSEAVKRCLRRTLSNDGSSVNSSRLLTSSFLRNVCRSSNGFTIHPRSGTIMCRRKFHRQSMIKNLCNKKF